jgi:ribA/ribD-fused uncharacterized protein
MSPYIQNIYNNNMVEPSKPNKILFYGEKNDFGFFSNFYPAPIILEEKEWPTVEHYFQAKKFEGKPLEETIRNAATPGKAKKLGRSPGLRPDWEEVKNGIMYNAVLAKFGQNAELLGQILATGDAELAENSPSDYYWGVGSKGTGKNHLGLILMKVRSDLISKQSEVQK